MTEEERNIEEKIMPWRFWLLLTLSLLLIVTFGLYIPVRFQHQALLHDMDSQDGQMVMSDNHADAGHAASVYHEESDIREGLAVNLNITPVPVFTESSARLDFFVNQKPGNIGVDSSQLQLTQTKLMHVIGVRNDMDEFFHIHPQPTSTPGMLTIAHTFAKPGNYKMWSEISKDGTDHIFGHPQINVSGSGQAYNKEIFVSHSSVVDGYQVVANYEEPLARQQQSSIAFEIHDSLGREVQVEPYLGEDIHLTIIKDDWKQFIHAHPGASMTMPDQSHQSGFFPLIFEAQANGAHPPEQMVTGHGIPFSVMFFEGGVYRMYAQFRPKGSDLPSDEALTAMFWVRVSDTAPSLFSTLAANWWLKLIISAVLIVILSMGMKKFLSVSPS